MELQSPYKYEIDILTRQRRDLLLPAASRTSFLEQKKKKKKKKKQKMQTYKLHIYLTTPRPNTKFGGGGSVSGRCVSAELRV